MEPAAACSSCTRAGLLRVLHCLEMGLNGAFFFLFFFSIKYFVVQKLQDLLEAALHTGMLLGH